MTLVYPDNLEVFDPNADPVIDPWVRPMDWPAMPADATNKVSIITAVFNDASNYVALNCAVSSGNYQVDWGDGTVDSVASTTQANHTYDYADADLPSVTARGYKCATIIITPVTGGANITSLTFNAKNTRTGLQAYSQPWLDILINAPSCTTLNTFGGSNAPSRLLERVDITAIGGITTLANAFLNCRSLQVINFPSGSLASVTTLNLAFSNCGALQQAIFPDGGLASVTNIGDMFNGCAALRKVVFPSGSLASVTTAPSAFSGCRSLRTLKLPPGSFSSGSLTSINGIFTSCSALERFEFPSGSLGSVTNIGSAFSGCSNLKEVVFPSGLSGVTSMNSTFASCLSLQRVSFPSGALAPAGAADWAAAFLSCGSLEEITFPSGSGASVTTLSGTFNSCGALRSVSFASGSLANVTTLANAFATCTALQKVEFPSGSLGSLTDISGAFSNCNSLQEIVFPAAGLGAITNTSSAFSGCPSLGRIQNCDIPVSFSVAQCKLSGTALDEIYTALPTITSQTITVTNNHGTVDDTPAIAEGKGWLVTGS